MEYGLDINNHFQEAFDTKYNLGRKLIGSEKIKDFGLQKHKKKNQFHKKWHHIGVVVKHNDKTKKHHNR